MTSWILSRRDALKAAAIAAGGVACRHVDSVYSTIAEPSAPDALARSVYAKTVERARALQASPYVERVNPMPAELHDLGYSSYQAIRYLPEASLPLGPSFAAQFFHRGHLHKKSVEIFLQPRNGEAKLFGYDAKRFDLGEDLQGRTFPPELGYAGFRIHYPFPGVEEPFGQKNEFLVFLDASYFRLRGAGQSYGLSGRGIAIDTGRGDKPEEFPDFTTFWLVEPDGDTQHLDIVALLDGPSVTGAFLFRAKPGASSALAVEATLFPRAEVETFGVAPLTSMFVHGSNGPVGHFDDFRPEVHDSDGLFLRTKREPAAWRPLINDRPIVRTSSFKTPDVEGFGLLQRQRDYRWYLDVGARHEDRPGVMVDVERGFGPGAVRLYEIPSPEEYMDNIVAYYVHDTPPKPGDTVEIAYRLTTVGGEPVSPLPHVMWTRIGSADRMRPTEPPIPGRRIYFIDWEGNNLPIDKKAPVIPVVTASAGEIVLPEAERVEKTGGWRCYFEHRPTGQPAELRAHLTLDGKQIVETWLYGA